MREEISWFADRMEEKLRRRERKKGGWQKESFCDLFKRLTEERDELLIELYRIDLDWPVSITDIIDECVDVANFAMMIADNARRL